MKWILLLLVGLLVVACNDPVSCEHDDNQRIDIAVYFSMDNSSAKIYSDKVLVGYTSSDYLGVGVRDTFSVENGSKLHSIKIRDGRYFVKDTIACVGLDWKL